MFAWSKTDYSQLEHEIRSKGIEDLKIEEFMHPERWIDYQAEFGKRFDFSRAVSLEEALMSCDIDIKDTLWNCNSVDISNLIIAKSLNC